MTRAHRHQSGYTYLLLLFGVAAMGLVTAVAAKSWGTLAQRERERELLFAGNQYREALSRYRDAVPDAVQRLPTRLEQLLEDTRFAGTRRHLRKLYPDPMTGAADWVLLREGEGIIGVHSRALGKPLKQAGFGIGDEDFANASRYTDWKFIAAPSKAAPAATPPAALPVDPATPGKIDANSNSPTG